MADKKLTKALSEGMEKIKNLILMIEKSGEEPDGRIESLKEKMAALIISEKANIVREAGGQYFFRMKDEEFPVSKEAVDKILGEKAEAAIKNAEKKAEAKQAQETKKQPEQTQPGQKQEAAVKQEEKKPETETKTETKEVKEQKEEKKEEKTDRSIEIMLFLKQATDSITVKEGRAQSFPSYEERIGSIKIDVSAVAEAIVNERQKSAERINQLIDAMKNMEDRLTKKIEELEAQISVSQTVIKTEPEKQEIKAEPAQEARQPEKEVKPQEKPAEKPKATEKTNSSEKPKNDTSFLDDDFFDSLFADDEVADKDFFSESSKVIGEEKPEEEPEKPESETHGETGALAAIAAAAADAEAAEEDVLNDDTNEKEEITEEEQEPEPEPEEKPKRLLPVGNLKQKENEKISSPDVSQIVLGAYPGYKTMQNLKTSKDSKQEKILKSIDIVKIDHTEPYVILKTGTFIDPEVAAQKGESITQKTIDDILSGKTSLTLENDLTETERDLNNSVYDEYIYASENQEVIIDVRIYPLLMRQGLLGNADIVAYINDGKNAVVETTKSANGMLSAQFGDYKFTIMGKSENKTYETSCLVSYATGDTIPVESKKIEVRPEAKESDLGHIVYEIDYQNKLHVIPVEERNMKNKNCRSILIIEKQLQEGRGKYIPEILLSGIKNGIEGEGSRYSVQSYMDERQNKFKIKVYNS